jgi:CheY-like chemotaxis protein
MLGRVTSYAGAATGQRRRYSCQLVIRFLTPPCFGVGAHRTRRHDWWKGAAVKTLLIVEHGATVRRMVLEMMRLHKDWRAMAVADCPKLLKSIHVFKPDLVILDIAVDHADGMETYRLLRQHPYGAAIPVLLVTAGLIKVEAAALNGGYCHGNL